MSAAKSLLIELGTEELPPKALDELSTAFLRGICDGLAKRDIAADLDAATAYASPRRLAVHIPAVAAVQPEQRVERRGPALSAALDKDGRPSKALLGFAQSCGVDVAQLEKLETDKGGWYVARTAKPARPLAELLPEIIDEALKGLPIPRPMRWASHDYSFVRPAHWLVILHGSDILDGEVLGLSAGRISHGHRFMYPKPVHVADADSWLDAMRAAKVLADPAERRQRIHDEIASVTAATGGVPRLNDGLLNEIANLTEWPVAIACTFEPAFLAVPPEALVMTMETNQKFVPVFDADGKLTEHFIGIANIESNDPAEIRKGYERVIRPRFADAKFFWDEDLKTPLASQMAALKNVTYQQALGSVWDKSVRVAELARIVANRVGVDAGQATRAAALSKCDLLTRMVGEFPELQGVMGRYYATHDGETLEVAEALDSFYQPRFGGDVIAAGKVGQVLAVAERLDTLAGIFAVGLKPSGNKDPFALRRAALGLARTLIEGGLEIDLRVLIQEHLVVIQDWMRNIALTRKAAAGGVAVHGDDWDFPNKLTPEIYRFVMDRLRGYYAEQGFAGASFEAVLAMEPGSLPDFDRRLRAVAEFGRRPEAASLAAANKRVANILRKQSEEAGATSIPATVDPAHFEQDAERDLAEALASAQHDTAAPLQAGHYTAVLNRLSQLQAPVDACQSSRAAWSAEGAVQRHRRYRPALNPAVHVTEKAAIRLPFQLRALRVECVAAGASNSDDRITILSDALGKPAVEGDHRRGIHVDTARPQNLVEIGQHVGVVRQSERAVRQFELGLQDFHRRVQALRIHAVAVRRQNAHRGGAEAQLGPIRGDHFAAVLLIRRVRRRVRLNRAFAGDKPDQRYAQRPRQRDAPRARWIGVAVAPAAHDALREAAHAGNFSGATHALDQQFNSV
jgi:glycyl-tRNA synthetase beta chain